MPARIRDPFAAASPKSRARSLFEFEQSAAKVITDGTGVTEERYESGGEGADQVEGDHGGFSFRPHRPVAPRFHCPSWAMLLAAFSPWRVKHKAIGKTRHVRGKAKV